MWSKSEYGCEWKSVQVRLPRANYTVTGNCEYISVGQFWFRDIQRGGNWESRKAAETRIKLRRGWGHAWAQFASRSSCSHPATPHMAVWRINLPLLHAAEESKAGHPPCVRVWDGGHVPAPKAEWRNLTTCLAYPVRWMTSRPPWPH